MNAYKLWKDAANTKSGSREKLGTEAAIHRGIEEEIKMQLQRFLQDLRPLTCGTCELRYTVALDLHYMVANDSGR